MISSTAHAAASYSVLAWISVGSIGVALISSVLAARSFRMLIKRTSHGAPSATLAELLKHRFVHHSHLAHHGHPVATYDPHDHVG